MDLERGPGFARAKNPQAFRDKLAAALRTRTAAAWEELFNKEGIPAARVRHLAEFTAEAQTQGALKPIQMQLEGFEVATPGLGWTSN